MTQPSPITQNIRQFEDALNAELTVLGRERHSVTLVAVTKTVPPEAIASAIAAGLTDLGENRVQEAKVKISQVRADAAPTWHLIGHLQTNKTRDAVALFDLIQSVDRGELADAIEHRSDAAGKTQDVLIEVNTTGERQKSGCRPESLDDLVGHVVGLRHLRIRGLMTIGPFVDETAPIARSFRTLRSAFDRLARIDLGFGAMLHCSMGMSGDWRIALAEGSTMLRIGRAIFGERH
ncbi:MAG TPA: YggS family pyridoxal phosphate-dependent enzyme [candidate division Zixibacteria bacterium]|jgi:pyridoxal phosphate enzyme (YggS family)